MASLNATLTSPAPSVKSFGGGAARLNPSGPRVTGSMSTGLPTFAVLRAPSPVLSSGSGGFATLNPQMPALVAAGSVSAMLYAAIKSPMPVLAASGFVAHQAAASLVSPSPSLSSRSGHVVALRMPTPVVMMLGGGGTVGAFAGRMPMPVLMSSGGAVNHGRAVLVAPMLRAVNSGRFVLASPSPRFVASGRQVSSITHVAYSFNIKPDNRPGWSGVVVVDAVRYPDYPLTKIVMVDGRHLGISDSGVYELAGDTDNGAAIPWSWMTATSDMGSTKKKTIVSAYIGGEVPRSMRISVLSGDSATDPYAQTVTRPAELVNHRQKFGLGRKARYYAIGMSSASGKLEMENIELEVAEMNRRI